MQPLQSWFPSTTVTMEFRVSATRKALSKYTWITHTKVLERVSEASYCALLQEGGAVRHRGS